MTEVQEEAAVNQPVYDGEDVAVVSPGYFSEGQLQKLSEDFHIIRMWNKEAINEVVEDEDDADEWRKAGESQDKKDEVRCRSRILAKTHAYVKRALRLYELYVFGSGFDITLKPFYLDDAERDKRWKADQRIIRQANRAWKRFLLHNRQFGWTPQEFGRRVWRDGEQFTRKFKSDQWPPELRFIDPEEIDTPENHKARPSEDASCGIVCDADDNVTVRKYLRIKPDDRQLREEIQASSMWHTKIDVDSTEKRGVSRFYSVLRVARLLSNLITNEVVHRNAQSAIILVRKVIGGTGAARSLYDNARTGTKEYPEGETNREKWRAGTILTTTTGVDYEFKSPEGKFSDASPLVSVLIKHICAATGWSYAMISLDSSEGSFDAQLAEESPVLQMVQDERQFFEYELIPIFMWVIEEAFKSGQVKANGVNAGNVWTRFDPSFKYGQIHSRDPLKLAQAANLGVMNGAISTREASRRMEADPDEMMRELSEEAEWPFLPKNLANMNPDGADKAASSGSNANQGGGTNQDQGSKPAGHKDGKK